MERNIIPDSHIAFDRASDSLRREGRRLTASTRFASACCAVAMASAFPQIVFAQETRADSRSASNIEIPDIIVTAEKRSTSLQRTPVAVTVVSGDQLARAQITDMRGLSAIVPNFRAAEAEGFPQITIRGIGIQNFTPLAESAVAVNINEVYVARPSGFLASMFDISAVEVLRGPQGTLFGRNATAGAVNMSTTRPGDDLGGYARLAFGNFKNLRGEIAIGGPAVPGLLSVRVAAFAETRDGYGTNLVTGSDIDDKRAQGVRGTIVLTPADGLKITAIAEYYHQNDRGGAFHYFGETGTLPQTGNLGIPSFAIRDGGVAARNPYDLVNDTDPFLKLESTMLTGIVEYSSGPFSVKSITGYRDQKFNVSTDLDGTDLQYGSFLSGEPADQFSQEIQFHYDTDRMHLTAGLYYFREKDASVPALVGFSSDMIDPVATLFGIPGFSTPRPTIFVRAFSIGGTIWTHSKAAFAQGSYEVADGLSLIAGIRFSQDKKHLVSNFIGFDLLQPYSPTLPPPADQERGEETWNSTTPKFGLQYQVSPRTLIYATYAKGFKAGGFDASTDPNAVLTPTFNPEKVTSYELGLKTTLLNGMARANLAGFYYDYADLQVSQAGPTGIFTSNAGKARIYGIECEFTLRPTEQFEIGLNGSYLNARYRTYFGVDNARPLLAGVDFGGNYLNNAPEWSGSMSAQYTVPVGQNEFVLRGEGEFSSRFYFSPGNYTVASQGGYAKANAYVSYHMQSGLDVTAFVRNITNKTTKVSASIESVLLGAPVQGSLAPPRTYGIEATYRF